MSSVVARDPARRVTDLDDSLRYQSVLTIMDWVIGCYDAALLDQEVWSADEWMKRETRSARDRIAAAKDRLDCDDAEAVLDAERRYIDLYLRLSARRARYA